jgi:hypothetical protein
MRRLLLTAAALLAGCVDADGARQTAEAYGFTDIVVTGSSGMGCGERDTYSTAIEATNPGGDRVAAVVCSGDWGGKYGTLRIERIMSRGRPAAASVPLAS